MYSSLKEAVVQKKYSINHCLGPGKSGRASVLNHSSVTSMLCDLDTSLNPSASQLLPTWCLSYSLYVFQGPTLSEQSMCSFTFSQKALPHDYKSVLRRALSYGCSSVDKAVQVHYNKKTTLRYHFSLIRLINI